MVCRYNIHRLFVNEQKRAECAVIVARGVGMKRNYAGNQSKATRFITALVLGLVIALLVGGKATYAQTADLQLTDVRPDEMVAASHPSGINIHWQMADETSVAGYNVFRQVVAPDVYVLLNDTLIPVSKNGSPASGFYDYVDVRVLPNQTYQYLIELVRLDGSKEVVGTINGLYTATTVSMYLPVVVN